ncbi:MAG: putative lipid II flippase FtsW [Candidatus Dormibacteraeota bacterium]|nr:putative lipid II flippase FtsW [Candidatus Dormibacteraeota bacterium]
MRQLATLELPVPRRTRSLAGSTLWRRGDKSLILAVATLSAFGLVMVFSASEVQGWLWFHNAAYYFERQLVWLGLGLVLLWFGAHLDYHRLRPLAGPLGALTMVLLVLVLLPHFGREAYGARRWLQFGPLSMQPAELAKATVIVFMAVWLERHRDRLTSLERGVVPFLALLGLVVAMIILERDLGTTMIVAAILLAQFLVAGGKKRHLLLLLLIVGLAGFVFIRMEPYRLHRIMAFLNPWSDPLNTGFQSIQSVLALGSGGIFGLGLGQSIQKYQWLPFAHTDFIFAIVGEETGLIGTTGVLALFGLFAYRGYRIALKAPDALGSLLACGVTTWVAFEALINIAAVTVTLPTTGIPLPFISYGGSSLAITLLAVGILMNVAMQGEKVGWIRHAGIDLGRRNGRTLVPSDRGRPGPQPDRP